MVTKAQVLKVLKSIPDPELGISVWDLGLIYKIDIDKDIKVNILMTLTSIGCPLFNLIADPIKTEILKIKGVKDVFIDLTFEPVWTTDLMSKKAKLQLGII
jgi:metal-sulfur cluster biosynthetic enzyme